MLKKFLCIIFVIITLLSINITILATETTVANEKTVIKVGYLENYAIFNSPSIRGAEGFGYEYLSKIEKYTNYKFEYVPVGWNEGFEMLNDGEVDLIGPVSMTKDRQDHFSFIETSFCNESVCIYAPKDAPLYYNNPKGLNGLTIGVLANTIYQKTLMDYIEKNNLDLKIKFTETYNYSEYLENGEIDIFLSSSLFQTDNVKIVEELYNEPLYFITSKDNSTLCYNIENTINKIEEISPYFNETLWYKYYGENQKANKHITQKEKLALAEKDNYIVGYHADLHPISYKSSNGKPAGYAIDIMNILAENLDIKVTYIPLHDGRRRLNPTIDFNLCPLNDNCATHCNFSKSYDKRNLMVLQDNDVDTNDIKNILVRDYAALDIENFLQDYFSATIHKSYSSSESSSISKKHDIDCIIVLEGSKSLVEDIENKIISVLDVYVPIGISVSNKLPPEVLSALNTAISSLNPTTVDEIVLENTILLQPNQSLINIFYRYQLLISVVAAIIISSLIIFLRVSNDKITHLLETDTLTGLLSTYKFTKKAERILASSKPNEYIVILLDIDNFKIINRIYGTDMGDKVLCTFANILKNKCQPNALTCRVQNDTFAIFTKHIPTLSMAKDNFFYETISNLGIDITLHFSAGAYIIQNTNDSIAYMLDCARTAKNYGKSVFENSLNYFTEDIKIKHEKEIEILTSTEAAILNQDFYIQIQPKVQLQTEKPIGGEVLVRWNKTECTHVYPDEFIPLFEKYKVVSKLDKYVFDKACKFVHDAKIELPVLSVNVSTVTLFEENFIDDYICILNKWNLSATQFELELTESALNTDFTTIKKISTELQKLGFSISLDDFGKGASSLARIRELDVDSLKLDKNFININTKNEKGELVLQAIISMANGLNITTLAEGIETKEQKSMLIELGCECGQGYFFNKPLFLDEFITLIEKANKKTYIPVLRNKRVGQYWSNFENLHYGIAVIAKDEYATIIQANRTFYNMIGYSKETFMQNCQNHLAEILIDDLFVLTKKHLDNKQYKFSYDLRMLTFNKDIIWVYHIVEFDPENNLFFSTFIDITEQNKMVNQSFTHQEYSLQKEIARHVGDHISDYIYVTNTSNDEILYCNQSSIKLLGLKDESELRGKKYYKIVYGSNEPLYPKFYNNLSEDAFSTKEYYNEHLNMQLRIKVKLLTIDELKTRLHIVQDITVQHELKIDLASQTILLNCIENLYSNKDMHKAFTHILQQINNFYECDSSYYFELNSHTKYLENIFVSVQNGFINQSNDYNALSKSDKVLIINTFRHLDNFHFTTEQLLKLNLTPNIIKIIETGNIKEVFVFTIKDVELGILGFVQVINPQKNHFKTDLILVLSRFIGIFHRNNELKNFENDALLTEENSKLNILNTCSGLFQLSCKPNETFTDIVRLLRQHYNANFCMMLQISDDKQNFNSLYQDFDKNITIPLENFAPHQNVIIKSLIEIFNATRNKPVVILSSNSHCTKEIKEFCNQFGLYEAYFSPILGKNHEIIGLYLLGNPELLTRSTALLQVVAKYTSDYTEKISLIELNNEKLAIDPLSGLYNKLFTAEKIDQLLKDNTNGTIYMLDIDNFKSVNDTLGHSIGDNVVVDVANSLKKIFRKNDIIGRVGGDEFMVFCPNLLNEKLICEKAEMILDFLKNNYKNECDSVFTSASVGIYLKNNENINFPQLYKKVDSELYNAKRNGKNQFSFTRQNN